MLADTHSSAMNQIVPTPKEPTEIPTSGVMVQQGLKGGTLLLLVVALKGERHLCHEQTQ